MTRLYRQHVVCLIIRPVCCIAGLVRAEEVHKVQHKAAVRLEHLQHQRGWNIIGLEHQQAAQAPGEYGPGAFDSRAPSSFGGKAVSTGTGAAATDATMGAGAGVGARKPGSEMQQAEVFISSQPAGHATDAQHHAKQGQLLQDMQLVRLSMQQRANRRK